MLLNILQGANKALGVLKTAQVETKHQTRMHPVCPLARKMHRIAVHVGW
jgi:hypothetical protein